MTDGCLVYHKGCYQEEGQQHEDQAEDETLSARNQRLWIQFVPIDIIPVEGLLEDPIVELKLCSLRFGHEFIISWIYSNLSTLLDELFYDFLVFWEDERVTNILGNPVLFCPCQILENLLIDSLQFLCELFLRLWCHLTTAATFGESIGLLNLLKEELPVLGVLLFVLASAQAAPKSPTTSSSVLLHQQIVLFVYFPADFLTRHWVVDRVRVLPPGATKGLLHLTGSLVSLVRADSLNRRATVVLSRLIQSYGSSVGGILSDRISLALASEGHLDVLAEHLHFSLVAVGVVVRTHAVERLWRHLLSLVKFLEELLLLLRCFLIEQLKLL